MSAERTNWTAFPLGEALAQALAHQEANRRALRQVRERVQVLVGEMRRDLAPWIRTVEPKGQGIPPYVAVDSAFCAEQYEFATEYRVVAVAVVNGEVEGAEFYHASGEDLEAAVEMEGSTPSGRVTEGLGLSLEATLAQRYLGKGWTVHLDGSYTTFVIKLNALLTLVAPLLDEALRRGERGHQVEFLRRTFERGVKGVVALGHLLSSQGLVLAWTKGSKLSPFLEHHHLAERYSLPLGANDALLLDLLLRPGEWVEVPVPPRPYNLPRPKEGQHPEVAEGLRRVAEAAPRVISRLQGLRVVYLKGVRGKLYKVEVPVPPVPHGLPPFVPDGFYPLTAAKEFLPLLLADKKARAFLRLLDRGDSWDLRPYREAVWRGGKGH